MQQALLFDIARKVRRPLLVAPVDAAQCYDRIAHATAALTLRARQSSVASVLTPIQMMKYYLRTGFGESKTYSGGRGGRGPKTGVMPEKYGYSRDMATDQLGLSESTGSSRPRDSLGDTNYKEEQEASGRLVCG